MQMNVMKKVMEIGCYSRVGTLITRWLLGASSKVRASKSQDGLAREVLNACVLKAFLRLYHE